jgi:hypothetical protein
MRRATAIDRRGFTPAQHGYFRPLVEQAWAKHCQLNRLPASPAEDANPAYRAWYEDELEAATNGKRSTSFCDRKRDFTKAMAHFEIIVGESIFWQTRLYGDDARRIAWNIRDVCRENLVEENYMRGMAKKAMGLFPEDPLPDLDSLDYKDLLIIMGELKRFIRRGGRPGVKQSEARPSF